MWNAQDIVLLRAFIEKCPHFIDELTRRASKINTDAGVEQAALTGASHAGCEKTISDIKEMARDQIRDEKTPYIPEQ